MRSEGAPFGWNGLSFGTRYIFLSSRSQMQGLKSIKCTFILYKSFRPNQPSLSSANLRPVGTRAVGRSLTLKWLNLTILIKMDQFRAASLERPYKNDQKGSKKEPLKYPFWGIFIWPLQRSDLKIAKKCPKMHKSAFWAIF